MGVGIYIDMGQPEKTDCSAFGEVESLIFLTESGRLFRSEAA
jgi:hypothetical protein